MILLAYPWLLWLLPLPLLLRRLLPAYREPRQVLRLPWFDRIAALAAQATPWRPRGAVGPGWWGSLILALAWLLLVLALARPQLLEPPLRRVETTRDLLLLVDLSGSMETQDFTAATGARIDRLAAVKQVVGDFLGRRKGDRVGLIVFGSAAFVQVPFTRDLGAARRLLDETAVRMAGPRTAFGDAIGLGITLFERSDVEQRVMIGLTDGNDTGSRVPLAEAARIAADHGIVIYLVGVGDPAAVGEEQLDTAALEGVARATGGRYYHAAERVQLEQIYAELDRLSVRELEVFSQRPRRDLYHWPLGAFLLLGAVYQAGAGWRRGRADD